MLARLMESQIWHQLASSVGLLGEGSERDNGLCPPFYLRKNCPPALTLMPNTLFPPHMPLVPFKLQPWYWILERVSMNKSMCGFFKGNCLGLKKFLPLTQSPSVFSARSYGELPSWYWITGLRSLIHTLVWGWDSSLLRYPSQIFIHYT